MKGKTLDTIREYMGFPKKGTVGKNKNKRDKKRDAYVDKATGRDKRKPKDK